MSWLRTSSVRELVDTLRFVARCSQNLNEDPESWRWLILSLHLGVQGALVCALKAQDTSGVSILATVSAKRMQEWLEASDRSSTAAPNQQLAPMRDLLKRAQSAVYLPDPHRLPFPQATIDDVLRLNDLRNKFAHFVVDGWTLELDGLPRIALHTIDVIEHLTLVAPTFWHWYEGSDKAEISAAIQTMRAALNAPTVISAGAPS